MRKCAMPDIRGKVMGGSVTTGHDWLKYQRELNEMLTLTMIFVDDADDDDNDDDDNNDDGNDDDDHDDDNEAVLFPPPLVQGTPVS
jgi:hypothetical protein